MNCDVRLLFTDVINIFPILRPPRHMSHTVRHNRSVIVNLVEHIILIISNIDV